MFKNILVRLDEGATRSVATDYALSIAQKFDAHAAGLAFAYEPVPPGTLFMSGMPLPAYESAVLKSQSDAKAAIAAFENAAIGASVAYSSHYVEAPLGDSYEAAAEVARNFDLAVIRQEEEDGGRQQTCIESVLFGSGRPVVVVPYIQKDGLKLDRVLVSWDRSQHAARAIGDALPLLHAARQIEVVTVASDKEGNNVPGADIGAHLARHGLKVTVRNIVAPDIEVAEALLSHAADMSADLMVMGGYGHSRLREFVLGGVTRTILSSMTVPVLMSH